MTDLLVRRAVLDDVDRIAAFNRAMAHETEGKELDPPTVRRGVARLIEDEAKGFYLVAARAQAPGAPVGQLMVTYEWSDWRDGWFWWLQSVYVEPQARRGGVFRALWADLSRRARERDDVRGLRLYVDRDNERARSTYLALGMHAARYDLLELDHPA